MLISEILSEAITPAQVEQVSKIKDIQRAKDETLQIMFANTSSSERRADLRDQVHKAGTVSQLVQQLWNMMLSKEIPTGFKTVKTKKGIGTGL